MNNNIFIILFLFLIILIVLKIKNLEHFTTDTIISLNDIKDNIYLADPTLTLSNNINEDGKEMKIVSPYLISLGYKKMYGFKASEIEKVFPEVKIVNKEVNNNDIVPILWQCCDKLQEKIEYYKSSIEEANKKIESIDKDLSLIKDSDSDKLINQYKDDLDTAYNEINRLNTELDKYKKNKIL